MKRSLFSIIIPTYNSGDKLEHTLRSVLSQERDSFEVVVIDGGSTDGSIGVIRRHAAQFPQLKWKSEKDQGVYDAMNKGITLSEGQFLIFLGAGDCLKPGILREMAPLMPPAEQGRPAFVYGKVFMVDLNKIYGGQWSKLKLLTLNLCHQGIFYEREVFDVVGTYNLKYPILADCALNLKCFGDERIRKVYVDRVISDYEGGGLSAQQDDAAYIADRPRLLKELGWAPYLVHKLGRMVPASWREARIKSIQRALKKPPRRA